MKVKEIMTKKPIVAMVPGNRRETLKQLVTNDKTGLPVLNRNNGTYVGFVTRQDFFKHPEEEQLALIMQRDFPSVSPETPVEDAARILIEREIHHLPVIDRKRNVAGIVTPADFLILIEKNRIKTPVHRFIRTAFIPVYEKTPLRLAAEITGMCNVYALPVLSEKGKLTGIITDRDIFNLSVINPKTAISDLGITDDMDPWAWEGVRNVMKLYYEVSKIHLPNVMVKDVMVKKPITAFDKTPVWEAARTMRKNDYGQLPVRNAGDKLLGMVYELDTLLSLIG
jgi:CBS domain-containing protein